MALIADRVFETTTTTGTGTLSLAGAQDGFRSFVTAFTNGFRCYYVIDAAGQSYWEIGIGTVVAGSPNQLQRTTILKSSNSDNAVDLPPGTKRVYTAPILDIFTKLNLGMRGHLAGLTLSNNGSDATNDIDVAAGSAMADDQSEFMVLGSALTKRLDAAWAVGTNQGGLDTGSIANTTYHMWLIRRPDTGVVDVLFSASASSPTMPSNYTQKRRIGSIIRTGGAIVAFKQRGDEFLLNVPVLDSNVTTLGTSASTVTLGSVPTGVQMIALLDVRGTNAAAWNILVSALDQADSTPGATVWSLRNPTAGAGSTTSLAMRTNTSGQVRTRSDAANTTLQLMTRGWIDSRGKDA